MDEHPSAPFFPAVICAEFDSPIDALVSLCVPHDEAMNLVAAWCRDEPVCEKACQEACILATLDGGRRVAVLRQAKGRWAACNAFLDHCCATRAEAERLLAKLLKRGRRGMVGVLTVAVAGEGAPAALLNLDIGR